MSSNLISDAGTELLIFVLTAPLAYFLGQRSAKNSEHRSFLTSRKDELINDIRTLSNDANDYYTKGFNELERNCMTASINTQLRRISSDLNALALCAKLRGDYFLQEYKEMHSAITSGQFGISTKHFEILGAENVVLSGISSAEEIIIRKVRTVS